MKTLIFLATVFLQTSSFATTTGGWYVCRDERRSIKDCIFFNGVNNQRDIRDCLEYCSWAGEPMSTCKKLCVIRR